jgi:prepilin-type N-terminal cleavage/methylation domain-containing protein/prepilin-type processing-associated H-X9-DG protein
LMTEQRPLPRRSGFTLVELLVVIGIIAILVGVLLPTLANARRSANAVKCGAALKELGNAFKLYSIDNRNAYPVAKWYIRPATAPPRPVLSNGNPVTALYWQDYLVRYISKNASINTTALDPTKQQAFALARASVFWGCPEWEGRRGGFATPTDGISAYENGYSFNVWPTWKPNQALGTHPPYTEAAVDDPVENIINGKWPRLTQYSAERCLVVESNLWLLVTCGTDSSHKALPELNCSNSGFSGSIGYDKPGYNSIDRYRHGKYPPLINNGLTFDDAHDKAKFNMLFGDGHVAMLQSIGEGMRAIQMRDP